MYVAVITQALVLKEIGKMEKMIRFSKVGYVLSKVIKMMAWIGCGLIVVSLGVFLLASNTRGLIYEGEGFSVYTPFVMSGYSLAQAIVATVISATGLVFLGFVMLELERILFGMKEGRTPFTIENVHYLRMISLFMLLAMVVGELEETILTGILNCEVNEETFGSILSVVIVYALSFVFEYGVKLQEQVDETL